MSLKVSTRAASVGSFLMHVLRSRVNALKVNRFCRPLAWGWQRGFFVAFVVGICWLIQRADAFIGVTSVAVHVANFC